MSQEPKPKVVPWRLVRSWECTLCGRCCINYKVPLTSNEYASFGPAHEGDAIEPSEGKHYLRRRADGTCYFLSRTGSRFLCTIQAQKPYVCMMFPFRISNAARFGDEELAAFFYDKKVFYVYLDAMCPGTHRGDPCMELVVKVIPEFVEMFRGNAKGQTFSTGTPVEGQDSLRTKLQRALPNFIRSI